EVNDLKNDLTLLLVEDAALITERNDVPQFVLAIDHRVSESRFEPEKIEERLADKIQKLDERFEDLVEELKGPGHCNCDIKGSVYGQRLGCYCAKHDGEHRHGRKCCEDGNGMG